MLIYLVEDSAPKSERIQKFLTEHLPRAECRTYGSYHSGLSAIVAQVPTVLLLDMTLPNFDRRPNSREGRLRALGGYELMRKLKLRRLTTRVIIVSQLEEFGEGDERVTFREIVDRCGKMFPDLLIGSVYFGQGSNSTWEGELDSLLQPLSTREIEDASNSHS